MKKDKVPHQVLNARYHEQEAHIIAQAGVPGAVTIATNMAGRGTDIQLGGNPDMLLEDWVNDQIAKGNQPTPEAIAARREKIKAEVAEKKGTALDAGGLYVIGTERHESRRIDNQLRGRSGRQGDPGRSRFFLSLEDDLMRIFGSQRMDGMLQALGLKEDEAIVHPWINKALEKAQAKVEARNFDIRKNLLKYDNVMNDQRKAIFEQRRELMSDADLGETIADMRHHLVDDLIANHIPEKSYAEQWDVAGLREAVMGVFDLDLPFADWAKEEGIAEEEVHARLIKATDERAAKKAADFGPDIMRQIEKAVLLQTLDHLWREHLVTLEHLRQVIGLRGYGQRDPLNEYKNESFTLFEHMLARLREAVTGQLMHVQLARPEDAAARRGRAAADGSPSFRSPDRGGRVRAGGGGRRGRWARRHQTRARAQNPRAEPGRSFDLGQGAAQRALPLRLRQEVQALPRHLRLGAARPSRATFALRATPLEL